MKKHPSVIAYEEWLATPEGKRCLEGEAKGIYLSNRLNRAFMEGYKAAEKNKSNP